MKTPLLLLALAFTAASAAENPAPAPDKTLLKARLSALEHRSELLRDEIGATDGRIEERIDNLLRALHTVGDSKDSRTKVTRMKEQTIDELRTMITFYQQKRAWLEEEMRRPTYNLTVEEKRRIIARFDEKTEKRVRQMLDLFKSFPTHQDYEQYKIVPNGGWFGGVTYIESEDYKQNKRLATHTNTQREKLMKDLKTSIDRLERHNRDLAQLQLSAPNEELRLIHADEQRKNEALIKLRSSQLAEVVSSPGMPTRPISGHEAQALDNSLHIAIDGIHKEFTNLFQRYSTWLVERSSVNSLKATLSKM
jgi:hypothetical protein